MNKRTWELIKLSTTNSTVDIEKFAALIISDCLRLCDAVAVPFEDDTNLCAAGGSVCGEMIRENFGITKD